MPHDQAVTVLDPGTMLGRIAVQLARTGAPGLPDALTLLVRALGLRSAVLRGAGPDGALLAVAGDIVHAVPVRRLADGAAPATQLPVRGPHGADLGTLTVVGARSGLLPSLRAVAAVIALTVSADTSVGEHEQAAAALFADAEADRSGLADALHDGPLQDLVAARYATDLAARLGDASLARAAVQQALIALRRAVWHLRPRGDDGLADALDALSGRLAEAGLPALELHVDAGADAVTPTAARAAYRLVQTTTGDSPTVVTVRREPEGCLVEVVGGRPLPDPARWKRMAQVLGADLTCQAGSLRLVLPLPLPFPTAKAVL